MPRPAHGAGRPGGSGGGLDLPDYLRMLRRGWSTIVAITLLITALAALYVVLAPKRYEAATSLFVTANAPRDISELSQGTDFSNRTVGTYADIVESATVLGPVADSIRPQFSVAQLITMVTAAPRTETSLIDVTVSGQDPAQVAAIANAVAASAIRLIPPLQGTVAGRPLVQLKQTRPATEPTSVVSPDIKKTLALGFIVGLCLGLGTTLVRQTLDTRIRRVDDLRGFIDIPVLAVLPPPKSASRPGLVVRDDPAGGGGNAFRGLRTNLNGLGPAQRRSLVVTAVADGRDGAQIAVNLAWSLARAGRRVLLVDADLRRSTVGDTLDVEQDAGLADVLAGRAGLDAVIGSTEQPGLRVVLAGHFQPGSADLLSAPALPAVLARMEQEHDHVILHVAPLLSDTDAAVVSAAAGGVVVTIAAGRNRTQELDAALNALARVGVRPLGMVLSGVRSSGGQSGPKRGAARGPVPHQPDPVAHPAPDPARSV